LESEHLKLRDFTINRPIPKYRNSLTQDNVRPSRVEILAQLIAERGPIRIQQDLLELIALFQFHTFYETVSDKQYGHY